MKTKITLVLSLLIVGFTSYSQEKANNQTTNKTLSKKELKKLKKLHAFHLENNPYKETFLLSKSERKDLGLPPNKYFEQDFMLTMNPMIGKPTKENFENLRNQLEFERNQALSEGRIPGDATDNVWIERGPNNVGGRTKALLFDPNDLTYNTVFAGGVSGGLWKNTNISNQNSTWSRVNFPSHVNVSTIVADPNNPLIFYIGTGESYSGGDIYGDGIWKSTDGGNTWFKLIGGATGTTSFQSASLLTVNSPSLIAGNYIAAETTAFGTSINSTITNELVLVVDNTAPTSDGCETITNSNALNGKIALIRRGNCTFVEKVKAAQLAGAIAVVVMNNVSGNPATMGGTDATITIPSVAISKETGDILESTLNLGNSINISLNPRTPNTITGNILPGIHYINDIALKNNLGTTEIYIAVGDATTAGAYLGSGEYGIYKSIDGGNNWISLNLPQTSNNNRICPMDIEIASDGKIWVSSISSAAYGDGGGKIFSSSDNGITFIEKHTVTGNGGGDRVEIEISSTNPNKIYVLSELRQANSTSPTIEVSLLKTLDAFATSPITLSLPISAEGGRTATYGFTGQQAFYDLMIEADPSNDDIVYVGGIDMFRTSNGGTSWSQITSWNSAASCSPMHSDVHGMAFKPGASNTAVIGCDGGVYFSSNLSGAASSSTAITSRNSGFNVTQFVGGAIAPTGATGGNLVNDYIIAGAQDNGSQYFASIPAGINNSTKVQSGDGGQCTFDQGADRYYTTSYVYNNSIYSRAATTTTTKLINSETITRGLFYPAMALDSNLDILYTDYSNASGSAYAIRRYGNVKATATGTVTKSTLTNALLTTYPTALTVSKYTTASTVLFVGTLNGKVLKLTNANTTAVWTDISSTSFLGSVSDIELGSNENQIFVTFTNFGVNNIWYTPNGGTNWYSIEGNLPDIPVRCILQNPLNLSEILIGTDLGIWYTNTFDNTSTSNQNLNWIQAYNGMSNVKVTDLDIRNDNLVLATTYGRGVFTGQLTSSTLNHNNFYLGNSIKVYPTVNDGNITIATDSIYGNTLIELFDLNGRKLFKKSIELNSNQNIDLGKHSTGNYILKLTNDSFTESTKLIIK